MWYVRKELILLKYNGGKLTGVCTATLILKMKSESEDGGHFPVP